MQNEEEYWNQGSNQGAVETADVKIMKEALVGTFARVTMQAMI